MDLTALKTLTGKKIAVIGDICLDCYYYVSEENAEVSVETGLQALSVVTHSFFMGAAANVALNCKKFGAGTVDLYGITGNDYFGLIVKSIGQEHGIGMEHVAVQKQDWSTYVYHKIYHNGKEQPRFDIGNSNRAEDSTNERLLDDLEANIGSYDAVLINEQTLTTFHTPFFQKKLNNIIEKYSDTCLWFTDCRTLQDTYRNTIHKCNSEEGRAIYEVCHDPSDGPVSEEAVMEWLYKHWDKPVVMTLGQNGVMLHDGKLKYIEGINIIKQIDPVGAGDAFFAGLAAAMISGLSFADSARVGNLSAAVCITMLGQTGNPGLNEVMALAGDTDYRYNPGLAEDLRKARYLPDSEIEVISGISSIQGPGFPDIAIFDHDGTISTLREGWEPIMKQIMLDSILGDKYDEADLEQLEIISGAVDELIEKTTGVQTIVQMYELAKLVEQFGYVPKQEIRSPHEYKKAYNSKLMEKVSYRQELYRKGILSIEDVTIKGAVPFLRLLHRHGTKIYLASGTDREDVIREAGLLGYAELFTGGIYGSVGDVANDPKKLVMKKIISDIGDAASCVVFGDGAVEIREAKKRNITAVGLISDEKRRFGKNLSKRKRLVLAGADVIIPDFSDIDKIVKLLGLANE